ncbi:TSUP family transporter [candidate division KSB1 bacterium]|nr:TSUP family transporter [candidate division KSB1 bacterium]
MADLFIYILIGTMAGIVMGTVGVGGGAIIIFFLLYMAHFPQTTAQGTTLLVVAAPVSLLAAYNYYRKGFVQIKAALQQ